MIKADEYFKRNLEEILDNGCWDENPRPKYKDGTPAHTKFITQVIESYDLSQGEFPITTLRNTAIKTGISEILWIFIDQSADLEKANERGILWWNNFDIGDGTIGDRYGETVFQYNLFGNLLANLQNDPFGRRHIMSLWQEEHLQNGPGLMPCAYETIWSCRKIGGEIYLDMTLIQRSQDYLMAGYINKTQYVALQMMIANELGFKLGKFVHFVQNLHIYDRHLDMAKELLEKTPLDQQPTLELSVEKPIYDIKVEDFKIKGIKGITKLSSPLEIAI